MKSSLLKKAEKIIEKISDTDYFKQAVTHISFCHENNLPVSSSYENLEFFGDSILNFQTCVYIFHNFPHFNEGKMSKLKQLMVQEKTLALLSKEINLIKYSRLGVGEQKNGGLAKNSILADVFESFIAALYLTKGNKEVKRFLQFTLFTWIKGKENIIWDYKTQLQEYCQAQKRSVNYQLISGNDENKKNSIFIVKATDNLNTFEEVGEGKNRKEAEQNAAEKVLNKLGVL